MNNQIVVAQNNMKGLLNGELKGMFRNALKENAGPFMSSLIDLYSDPQGSLYKCDPNDVAMEALKAATLKLPINKTLGFAYIVPYKNKPTFTIGYKGYIQLAMRTGQYKNLNAGIIYEGMELEEDYLTGTFAIKGKKESNQVLGYFCYFKLINGFEKALYMSKEEIEEYGRKYSPSFNSKYSPWQTEFDGMGLKTVVRRLLGKYGVLSIEMQDAIKDEEDIQIRATINNNANKTVLPIEDKEVIELPIGEDEVVNVDTETGEVLDGQMDVKDYENIKAPF
ncbi:recombinase [Anaerosphaera multitolerans]|uniref:Recombinase n=2 Tax=Anaerosphaera multitolerans TaxID=2487351 RepID=A0A437S7U5_9FIRM|nr:recombinase [Anaerosphaera multitolerans]